MASSDMAKQAIWMKVLLSDLHRPVIGPLPLLNDNFGNICICHNPGMHSSTKHIAIHHHFIREKIADGEMDITHCPTGNMVADILTKAFPKEIFVKHRDAMGLRQFGQV